MRLWRSLGRLRLLTILLLLLAGVYVVTQFRTSSELDQHQRHVAAAAAVFGNNHHGDLQSQRGINANYNYDGTEELVTYRKDVPLIWIGGVPRSGTTLMRAMMDAHPEVRCGEETRVVPRVLAMHVGMSKSDKEMQRLQEAQITQDILDDALAAYLLTIISRHGEVAPRLCNKDPFTLRSMGRLLSIFPNSQFLFMVRDGRATCHSIITRHVTIKGFDIKTYAGCLKDWSRAISSMNDECNRVGPGKCMRVFYEQLVLHPRAELESILKFLGIPWSEIVMHHERTINKTGGISLSNKELSTDQVDKPVNTAALTSWVEHFPEDIRQGLDQVAPMLQVLGYDISAYPPNYGQADDEVVKNDQAVRGYIKDNGLIGRIVQPTKRSHTHDQ